ncbi:MAG: DUF2905 domain-containing protein [Candidatus Hydrogenedentota bacterium]
MQPLGRVLIAVGAILLLVGLILVFGGGRYLTFLGRLPGDIRVEGEHTRLYFPITTCIIISVALTAILYLFSRFR